jgi:hypothetical protein
MTNLCEYLGAPVTVRALDEVQAFVAELNALMERNQAARFLFPGKVDLPSILAEERCFLFDDFGVPHVQWVSSFPGLRPKTRIQLLELVLPQGADVGAVEERRRVINLPYPLRERDPADLHFNQEYFCIFGANPISLDWLRYCRSLGAEVRPDMRLYGNNLLVETCIDADDLPPGDVVDALRLVLGACDFDLKDAGFDDYGINAPAVAHLAKHARIAPEALRLVLGEGASPDEDWTCPRNMNSCNLLNYAAEHGGSVPSLLALRPPPQVDKLDGAGFTALETVAFCRPVLESAVALIDAGADLSKVMVEEDETLGEYLERNAGDDPVFVAINAYLKRAAPVAGVREGKRARN